MYFIHKVVENNESFKTIAFKYFNFERCWVVLEKINEKLVESTGPFLKIGTKVYVPIYFNKTFTDTKTNIRVFLNNKIEENSNTENVFRHLNFYLVKNDNYFEFDQFYNINQEEFFKSVDINNTMVHNKIMTFSYPNADKHIFLFKKYGLGKILFLPNFFYIHNLLKNKANLSTNENFSKTILNLLDKATNNIRIECCINQETQLTSIDKNLVQYLDCSKEYDLDYLENIINNQVFDSGSSLIVLLTSSSSFNCKSYFQTTFGVTVSDTKIIYPTFQYRPFGLLQAADNYADISNFYSFTMAEMSQLNKNATFAANRHQVNNFNFSMKFFNENTLPLRPFSKPEYTSFDAFNFLINKKSLDRISKILHLVYYYDIELFNNVTCLTINNFSDEQEYLAIRLSYKGEWHEVLLQNMKINENKILSIENLSFYLALAVYKLLFKKEIDYSYLNLVIDSIETLETVELISLIYGSVPILRTQGNISTKSGICLILNEKKSSLDYHFKACAKNLDGSFYLIPDYLQDKNSLVWFPHLQNDQSKFKVLYQIKHVLELGVINSHVKKALLNNNEILLNSKNFIPIFLPDFFTRERVRPANFKYKLNIWFFSETSLDYEYAKYLFNGDIKDYSTLVSNKNFKSKSIEFVEGGKLMEAQSINIEIEKNQVFLILIDNLNKTKGISVRIVFNELHNKMVPVGKHQIKENDTLRSISKKYYDDESKWQLIYEENKTLIGLNSDQLELFSVLEIPKLI